MAKTSNQHGRATNTVEARQNRIIAAAMDLAEKQINEGTAAPSVITHFLKLGSIKEQYDLELLKSKKKLLEAQTDAMESAKKSEDLYRNAINAMRMYTGNGVPDDEDED